MNVKGLLISLALLPAALPVAVHAESIEEKAQICTGCHGDNGVPPQQAFPVPVIWGQQLGYLFFQLRDFKSGARKNDVMTPIAQGLEQSDLMALATYFSKKPWPNLRLMTRKFTSFGMASRFLGRIFGRSFRNKQPKAPADETAVAQRVNASVVCTSCHQEGFKGDSVQPRLAGQERSYLAKTMTDFATGARGNNPGMTGFMKGLTEQEINAMATWLAGM